VAPAPDDPYQAGWYCLVSFSLFALRSGSMLSGLAALFSSFCDSVYTDRRCAVRCWLPPCWERTTFFILRVADGAWMLLRIGHWK